LKKLSVPKIQFDSLEFEMTDFTLHPPLDDQSTINPPTKLDEITVKKNPTITDVIVHHPPTRSSSEEDIFEDVEEEIFHQFN
jgi:hypothetical protein